MKSVDHFKSGDASSHIASRGGKKNCNSLSKHLSPMFIDRCCSRRASKIQVSTIHFYVLQFAYFRFAKALTLRQRRRRKVHKRTRRIAQKCIGLLLLLLRLLLLGIIWLKIPIKSIVCGCARCDWSHKLSSGRALCRVEFTRLPLLKPTDLAQTCQGVIRFNVTANCTLPLCNASRPIRLMWVQRMRLSVLNLRCQSVGV